MTIPDDAPRPSAQAVIAFVIVLGLVVIALAAVYVAAHFPDSRAEALGITLAIVGGLLTALNAPTGIANVIQAAKGKAPAGDPSQGQPSGSGGPA